MSGILPGGWEKALCTLKKCVKFTPVVRIYIGFKKGVAGVATPVRGKGNNL